jgi:hypothetical protein
MAFLGLVRVDDGGQGGVHSVQVTDGHTHLTYRSQGSGSWQAMRWRRKREGERLGHCHRHGRGEGKEEKDELTGEKFADEDGDGRRRKGLVLPSSLPMNRTAVVAPTPTRPRAVWPDKFHVC